MSDPSRRRPTDRGFFGFFGVLVAETAVAAEKSSACLFSCRLARPCIHEVRVPARPVCHATCCRTHLSYVSRPRCIRDERTRRYSSRPRGKKRKKFDCAWKKMKIKSSVRLTRNTTAAQGYGYDVIEIRSKNLRTIIAVVP